uniref:Putative secreted protein n=1 Tax=Anopheles marajoara TaxID=58244 RepID=A0A2M4C867_9DIPT
MRHRGRVAAAATVIESTIAEHIMRIRRTSFLLDGFAAFSSVHRPQQQQQKSGITLVWRLASGHKDTGTTSFASPLPPPAAAFNICLSGIDCRRASERYLGTKGEEE